MEVEIHIGMFGIIYMLTETLNFSSQEMNALSSISALGWNSMM